jgi:outer membrane protein assembly factor BamB
MALSKGVVIASDITNFDEPNDNLPPGRLLAYDAQTGKLLRQFDPPSGFPVNFHPRGVVIGPNGLLYVSNLPNTFPPPFLGGQVLVFDPETFAFLGASSTTGTTRARSDISTVQTRSSSVPMGSST